jgi:hypothetical protein
LNKLRRTLVLLASLSLLLSLTGVLAGGALAGGGKASDNAVRHTGTDYNDGQPLPFGRAERPVSTPHGPALVGDVRTWLALDDQFGQIYLKRYTLRGVGDNIEVWVANNLDFPAGDCRNDGVRNVISDSQVDYLIDQFDDNIYPTELDWWGDLPGRDGRHSTITQATGSARGAVSKGDYLGDGDNVVVLVDNVRDSNFYDEDNQNTFSYIAGFFYSVFDDYFDRTIMSIDAWDWVHRTGDDPEHDPVTGPDGPCESAPARPNLYEGVFAHEYQHLLHHYTDPDEVNWVNEGLSDFTEVITGYADLSKHVDEKGYESHTQAYLGWLQVPHASWNPIPYDSGPENGLTAWGDQGDGEILADYGAAMYFMNFVESQGYGQSFFQDWFNEPLNGIDGMNATLAGHGSQDFEELFNDDIISALVDGYIDNGASVSGGSAAQFQNSAAEATVLINDEANATPGAPPWGADYIDLGPGSDLGGIVFDGDDVFTFPGGTEWVVDGAGFFTNPDVGGAYPNNSDTSIARSVAGHDGEILTFEHYYSTEIDWDFGFVQVSTDGGDTWTSLACSGTTTNHDPGAISAVVDNLPGYSGSAGTAGAPVSVTCPALPAGSTHLAFRLITDPAVTDDGWHVKNIKLDGADLGTPADLTGWDNIQFFSPVDLDFDFALVGIDGTVDAFGDVTAGDAVHVIRPTLGAGNTYTASAGDLAALGGFDTVVAIIWGIPADEASMLYQPYTLNVAPAP